ncbi:MAG TPA: ABC transporter permease subunit [Candidatus Limnocylindria bacterium]|nr:ABC transporter permease subunit [Candidatus Limnocylindria bacterium]
MSASSIRSLLWKEIRQIGRNRTAMLTAALLPFIILFLAPIQLLVAMHFGGAQGIQQLRDSPLPGFADVTDPSQLLVQVFYPLLLVVGGLLLPSLTTTYAIVTERERRSLELLISLPVSVGEILAAKLLAVLAVTAVIGLPYVSIVLTLLLVLGIAGPATIPALLAPFIAAVMCSIGISLLLTLLARDFRTANNLSGAFVVPVLFLTVATLGVVGGPARTYVLAAVLLALGAAATYAALRWITIERYLE